MIRKHGWIAATLLVVALATGAVAQMVPELSGPRGDAMKTEPAKPLPKWVVDDFRRMRAYPEQPPVIPHSIDGYQLSVNANRCLSCHKREFTQDSCTACHVPQADTRPLVPNTFEDMSTMGVKPAGSE